ncbi:MAG: serine O-acetyltransferase, partial [Hyphomicrobiales bacterium]|nr:serine O-acetyltransferase [Hyphomicrobiales bacterium]
ASRLDHRDLPAALIRQTFLDAIAREPSIGEAFRDDIIAVADRDPACRRMMEPLLYFKGFQALQAYRLSHWLLKAGRRDFALSLQSLVSATFGVDINPAARIGKGVFLDHASGLVVGETSVIEDNVSILQGVTLGGTGKERGDRHPKIRHGVLIGAGAKILGNIEIGYCARVAAGSVVLASVPHNKTVAGVPAHIVGEAGCAEPARDMNQILAEKAADA